MMQLVITDSSTKIGVLRSAYPGAQVLAVDFPLYARFSKNGKVKFDVWPKLKPVAKSKIESLITQASKCTSIIGIFDNSAYGRSLARDIKEALGAVNAQVSFLFPDVLSRDEIRCCDNHEIPEEPDSKYVADRIVTQRMNQLIADALPVYAEIELTRQQAFVLSSIYGSAKLCNHLKYTDSLGRFWRGNAGRIDNASTKFTYAINKLDSFPVFGCPTVSLERTWSAIEKLQAAGLIPTHESPISDDAFFRWCTYAKDNGLTPRTMKSQRPVYWVDDPAADPNNVVDEITARPLFRWLRTMTLMSCLEPETLVKLEADAGCMKFEAFIQTEGSWANLQDTQVVQPVELEPVRSDLCVLDPEFVSSFTILADCEGILSQREIWSSLLILRRNNLIKQRGSTFYPSSRGVIAVLVLQNVFPPALSTRLSSCIDAAVNLESPKDRVAELNAVFETYAVTKDITLWEEYTGGKAILVVSGSSAFFNTKAGKTLGIALADGQVRNVVPNKDMRLNCTCGSTVVKTSLDSTYEAQLVCASCNKEYALTTLKQMENANEA